MIRSGEHFVCQHVRDFVEKTSFDWYDVAEALLDDDRYDTPDIVDEANTLRAGEPDHEPFETVRDMPEMDVAESISAHGFDDYRAIIATLDADYREWVHLFDGHVHDVVELFPEGDQ